MLAFNITLSQTKSVQTVIHIFIHTFISSIWPWKSSVLFWFTTVGKLEQLRTVHLKLLGVSNRIKVTWSIHCAELSLTFVDNLQFWYKNCFNNINTFWLLLAHYTHNYCNAYLNLILLCEIISCRIIAANNACYWLIN